MDDASDDLDLAQQASQLAWHVASALRAGDLAAARRDCEQALVLAEASGAQGAASVRTTLGRVLLAQGELQPARACLEVALAVHRQGTRGHLVGLTLLELASCDLEQGDPDAAMHKLIQATTSFARAGEQLFEAAAQLRIAAAHHHAGQLDAARRHAEVAQRVAQAAGDEGLLASTEARLGLLLHERGQRRAAVTQLRGARSRFHGLGDRRGDLGCRLALVRLGLERGDEVHDDAEQLVAATEPVGDPWLHGQACSIHGAVLGATGDRLAYTVLARADAALAGHPLLRHLPPIDQGWLDLARGERDVAMRRFGAVPTHALRSIPLRLALAGLRTRLGQTQPLGA